MLSVDLYKETAQSSFELSKVKNKFVTGADFVMQVQPYWPLYLAYTALRCLFLCHEHQTTPKERQYEVWEKAQLYASVKVVGLVVSQIALSALGLTTVGVVAVNLAWGLVLMTMSCYAHHKSRQQEVENLITP